MFLKFNNTVFIINMNILFFSSKGSNTFSSKLELEGALLTYVEGDIEDILDVSTMRQPQIMFIGGFSNSEILLAKLELICSISPSTEVVLCATDPDQKFLMQAMRVGVREVIGSSLLEVVKDSCSRIGARLKNNKKQSQSASQIIGFMSAKGGDGGTCVAANIASALARDGDKRVLVIDLSLPFGDIEMFLTNQKQTHDLADFSDEIERLDVALMDSMVEHLNDNLDLIASPLSVDRLIHIKAVHIDRLIELSSSSYDYVIIDIGAGIDPISIHALGKLSQLIVVATMTVPSVKRATQVLRYWEELGLDASKLSLAVNRYHNKTDIKITDIEKAMKRRVIYYLPQDNAGVQESLLKGIPLIDLRPKSAFSKAILTWSSEWSGKTQGKSLWQRLKIK